MTNLSANANIPVIAASQVALPSNEDFTLFFDTDNYLHLTAIKNVGGVATFHDYEIVPSIPNVLYGTITTQTIGAVDSTVNIPFTPSTSCAVEIITNASNAANLLGFSTIKNSQKLKSGVTTVNSLSEVSDFATASSTINISPTIDSVDFTVHGNALETINWLTVYRIVIK